MDEDSAFIWAPVLEPDDDDEDDEEDEEDELDDERTDGDGDVLKSWAVDWLPFIWQLIVLFTFTDKIPWLLLLLTLLFVLGLDFLDGLHRFKGW